MNTAVGAEVTSSGSPFHSTRRPVVASSLPSRAAPNIGRAAADGGEGQAHGRPLATACRLEHEAAWCASTPGGVVDGEGTPAYAAACIVEARRETFEGSGRFERIAINGIWRHHRRPARLRAP